MESKDLFSSENDDKSVYEPINNYSAIELFAGAGGMALGIEKAGIQCAALNEVDKWACQTLKLNREHWNVIEGDIREKDFSSYKNKVEVVAGGFPCQAFSYAGKKLGLKDARGTLFAEFARVVKEVQPLMCIGENVRGLLTHDSGRTLEGMISILDELGYDVLPPRVLKANALKAGDLFNTDVKASEGQSYPERKKQIMDMIPAGGYWRDLPESIQKEYMLKSYYLGGGKTGMARRISWDEPCLTLTTSPAQKQTERCHPDETRPFNTREYARIQTFPDKWEFAGSMNQIYKQIGNAVPVNLAHAVFQQVVKSLNEYTIKNEIKLMQGNKKAKALM